VIIPLRHVSGGPDKHVEIDETLIGGRIQGKGSGRHLENKTTVLGMVERHGQLVTRVVRNNMRSSMFPQIALNVRRGSHVHTDMQQSYSNLGRNGFKHLRVDHSVGEYVAYNGAHAQTIEGFWAQLKRAINGTHIHVSKKHLPKYLGEFEYRWNMRHVPHLMLDRLMYSFVR
jgi:transposase